MSNPADFLQLDSRQIGYQCGTSEATVVRFCQRVGYRGLSEMKKVLSLELATALVPPQSFTKPDSQDSISERVFSDCISALKDTSSCIDRVTMERTASVIARSESIYLFGAGGLPTLPKRQRLNFFFWVFGRLRSRM
jgi:RpiR family transcriptional regulator, carbohydrate utilization regulator